MNNITTALILCGGKGTRFENRDKSLVKYNEKTILHYVLQSLKSVGIKKIVALTNKTSEIEITTEINKKFSNNIIIADPPNSFRETIESVKEHLPEKFLIVVGNQPIEKQHLNRMLKLHEISNNWVVSLYPISISSENITTNIDRNLNLSSGSEFVIQHPFILDKTILSKQKKEEFKYVIEQTIRFVSMETPVKGVLTSIPPEFDTMEMLERNLVYLKILELD